MPQPVHVDALLQAHRSLASGDASGAAAILVRAIAQAQLRPDLRTLLGRALWMGGNPGGACAAWREAMAIAPRDPEPKAWLAEGLLETGQPQEAARLAAELMDSGWRNPMPWGTGIRAHRQLGNSDRALAIAERAASLFPADPELLYAASVVSQENRRYRQAGALAGRLLAIMPGHAGAQSILVDSLSRTSQWRRLADETSRMIGSVQEGPEPGLLDVAFASDDPAAMARTTLAVSRTLPRPGPGRPPPARTDQRTAICYMSPDFREHPVARMLLPVLRGHDRSRFRIVTAAIRPMTGTIGAELAAASDDHLDLGSIGDDAAANLIAHAGVDVLIDLAGATTHNRYGILARRPAAVQLLWLGCPTGTGAAWYDGFLLDDMVCPPTSASYAREPIIRLATCYHPIPHHEPVAELTRAEFRLAPDDIVVACPHAPHKVRPPIVDVWMRLAAANPRVVLQLDAIDPEARAVIRDYATAAGARTDQIRFWDFQTERSRYLGLLRLADIFLDCHPYGAHSTTGEAIAVGLPVVTPSGRCIHARVAASMLRAAGLDHGICRGLPAYESLATALCRDRGMLSEWRTKAESAKARLPGLMTTLIGAIENACAGSSCRRPTG